MGNLSYWDQAVRHACFNFCGNILAAEPEVESLIPPLCMPEEPACVALGELRSSRAPPEGGHGKLVFLNILSLGNHGRGWDKSELT